MVPCYLYNPELVLENEHVVIYFDRTIHTHKTLQNNRPDITVIDKTKSCIHLVDIAVPLNRNLQKIYGEKMRKYSDLAYELKAGNKHRSVFILPIVISSTGIIEKHVSEHIKKLDIDSKIIKIMQKVVILNTCHIVRKFLQSDN